MRTVATALLILVAGVSPALGQTTTELKRMTLEQLMGVEVSTFSKVSEPSAEVPAAIFVLTADDIRRSGVTSLPEALRLVPGMQIARQDAARYSVGVRGFADRLSRAMLVLIDGRAVYSPLFAGTYWEVQNTLLQDVDRIEVIRGPGGTLWGANAVNGIINIITRKARDTQGVLAVGGAGPELSGPFSVRYGGSVGDSVHFRAYGTGFDRDAQFHADSTDHDAWRMAQGGFRADWSLGRNRSLTLQGDAYSVSLGQRYSVPLFTPPYSQTFTRDAPLGGGNVLARFSAPSGPRGEFQLQAYFDRTTRDERPVSEQRNTFDLDFQHSRRWGARHGIVWGAGYRVTSGHTRSLPPTMFTPETRTDQLFSGFAQDEVALLSERLRLTLGAKVEHNDYSGFEVQPSARAVWTFTPASSMFAAVTRAVRTPSRVETDYATTSLANPAVPAFVRLQPNPAFAPEKLIAYELGYRTRPARTLYATVSGFFNQLEDVLSTELLTAFAESTPPPARLILPVTFANGLHGNSHGVELTLDWRTTSWLRTTAAYSYLDIQLTRNPGSNDVSQERRGEGLSPNHQAQFQVSLDLPHDAQVDWIWRYVSSLPAGPVPAYGTFNVRVGWQFAPQFELSIVGQDLQQAHHLEWPSGGGGNIEVKRRGYVSVTWRR